MESVPKIEGHAAFYAHLRAGQVDEARMIGLENDRFVEKILFGRKYYEAPIITSRICGICPTIHSTTSIRAIEDACGITPTAQTVKLRKLLLCGQMIQSHSLHLYLLVLPDFVGVSSSFELQKSHPELFQNAIFLKRYADAIIDTIGGRAVHPITDVPGGFKHFPDKKKLKSLVDDFKNVIEIARKTVELFSGFSYPAIKQDLIYCALSDDKEYAFYDGEIKTSRGNKFQSKSYNREIYEEMRHYTRAKFGTLKGEEMIVGAMARMNLNWKLMGKEIIDLINTSVIPTPKGPLRGETEIQKTIGIDSGSQVTGRNDNWLFTNPFDNIIAQAIENYYFVLQSQKLIQNFISEGIDKKEPVKPPEAFGTGTAACEAPRGTLYHHYGLDKDGYIIKCDIITPTVQNLPAMEKDMKGLAPVIKDMSPEERTKTIEMLIRAYDPCITCATH